MVHLLLVRCGVPFHQWDRNCHPGCCASLSGSNPHQYLGGLIDLVKKTTLIAHLRTTLLERVAATEVELASTLAARNSDTKSSAGDKHEVGRAMVQQELDQLEAQLAKTRALLQELDRVPLERNFDHVAFGSFVSTDQGSYFIAIGLGALELNGEKCYVISIASPIGQAMQGKIEGDEVFFNGKMIRLLSIR